MKFALVDGQRREAEPGLSGTCPACNHPMVAKCGEVRDRHWAHKGGRSCDPWWENETEWHRAWKGQFPENWQEVVHQAGSGEKHIADVKTDRGWAIEFQHSYIKPEERRSRDAFYTKLIWVVDGARRKRDWAQFLKAWQKSMPVGANVPMRIVFSDECALVREWSGSATPIFFDFGNAPFIWWVHKGSSGGPTYISQLPRTAFVGIHRGVAIPIARDFDELVKWLSEVVALVESRPPTPVVKHDPLQLLHQRHLARRGRFRGRF